MQRLQVLNYKRSEYPNLCLCSDYVVLIMQESAFSTLTVILSDRKVHASHARMEMLLSISVNDKNWSPEERDEIIERATEIYIEKRRKKKLSTTAVHGEPRGRWQETPFLIRTHQMLASVLLASATTSVTMRWSCHCSILANLSEQF